MKTSKHKLKDTIPTALLVAVLSGAGCGWLWIDKVVDDKRAATLVENEDRIKVRTEKFVKDNCTLTGVAFDPYIQVLSVDPTKREIYTCPSGVMWVL